MVDGMDNSRTGTSSIGESDHAVGQRGDIDMASRREFIGYSTAASLALGLGCLRVSPANAGPSSVLPIYKAVYDARYAEGRRYADAVARSGVPTHAIAGDITDLWFNDLDLAWRDRQPAVAGLTTESALFCLEQLAWTHRMRVVFRADHAFLESGCVEHSVSCGPDAMWRLRPAGTAGRDWPASMALLHSTLASTSGTPLSATLVTPGAAAREDVAFLVSWVIAPASRT
jgi:hypothetical protein